MASTPGASLVKNVKTTQLRSLQNTQAKEIGPKQWVDPLYFSMSTNNNRILLLFVNMKSASLASCLNRGVHFWLRLTSFLIEG